MSQFLKLDYDLLENPRYLEFAKTPAHLTWNFLRMAIYRPPDLDPRRGDRLRAPFWEAGWLASHVSLSWLREKWHGQRSDKGILGDVARLEEMRLLEYYPSHDGRGRTIFRLGSWWELSHPGGSRFGSRRDIVEYLYAERIFLSRRAEPWAHEAWDLRWDHGAPARDAALAELLAGVDLSEDELRRVLDGLDDERRRRVAARLSTPAFGSGG